MKYKFLILFTLCLVTAACSQTKQDSFYVAFWNLENLFDTTDAPDKDDLEYTPNGENQWTQERLEKKMNNLSRVIRSMNNEKGPDILGVCEVEHQNLVDSMLNNYLRDKNYKTAYLESPDNRGIDNGLIYNSDLFKVLSVWGDTVDLGDINTRLILGVQMLLQNRDTIYFFVNHWPSRRGGEIESESKRIKAAETLRQRIDLILRDNGNANIVIMGDFNDEPTNLSIIEFLKAQPVIYSDSLKGDYQIDAASELFNLSFQAYLEGKGSYFYKDDFNMIDQIIASKNLITSLQISYIPNSFNIYNNDLLVTRTGKFQGAPFPTFGGRRYLGGYSDHFPVYAKFRIGGKYE